TPAMALRRRNAAPPTNPVHSRRVVVRSTALRQPTAAMSVARRAPMPSIATSMALAVLVGTRDWRASSTTAQIRLIAKVIAAAGRGTGGGLARGRDTRAWRG